ncbi:LuxR C-terminal-related transcriptional regulator [Pseudonocardia hispaniensis]|uniref:LuxR C-terminal-related transcriptional regulator n=1 Tax=Pseudonocardia hispaniensis TaxID=904933 RepID=A0ABW1J7N4_9PSEU
MPITTARVHEVHDDAAVEPAGLGVERLWRDGAVIEAIHVADQVLAGGADIDCRAAGVVAAAAAADGALRDAAVRWRGVAAALPDSRGAWALGRAALAAALAGDLEAADADLAAAREALPDPAPRGLTVLLDGVDATLEAQRGNPVRAARRLAGLAAATVPADPLTVERWDELAVTVLAAAGDDRTARAMLAAHDHHRPSTPRHRLLTAWLDLRAGRLAEARAGLAAAAETPVLRRNAVLAAAVSVGLARRCGDEAALAATWHRVVPVVVGADVEPLLLDVWGELAAAAARVSPRDGDSLSDAIAAAAGRAGAPTWCVASEQWWRLQRGVADGDRDMVASAAERLGALADPGSGTLAALAAAARTWATVLAGNIDPPAVTAAARGLADAGRPREAAALCRAAAERAAEPAAARDLLGRSRALVGKPSAEDREPAGGLSEREREVGALVLDGLTQKEIGARLFISPKTVEQHVARLRQKLGAVNRAQLVAALRSRLPAGSVGAAG